jgi:hypothetical protein
VSPTGLTGIPNCPKCGLALIVGSPTSGWQEKAKSRGLRKVAERPDDNLSEVDGVWLGDLISPESQKCPRCGAPVSEKREATWPDQCGLCMKKPASVFWSVADDLYVGLCYGCEKSEGGSRWVDEQRRKYS